MLEIIHVGEIVVTKRYTKIKINECKHIWDGKDLSVYVFTSYCQY